MTSVPTRTRSDSALTVDAFLAEKEAAQPRAPGRIIFALDATRSRQPTWDAASQLQGDMFREAMALGGIALQLLYYCGYDECRASSWETRPEQIDKLMRRINCEAGHTQISRVFSHACKETRREKVQAVVFIGDAMEEKLDDLCHRAGALGALNVPVFMFQEGDDDEVEETFREIARLTHGAYSRFDLGAAKQLAELLRAVAAFAAGGIKALAGRKDASAALLLEQMR
jgi:hypothetical protein